jgi:hypothetical protein
MVTELVSGLASNLSPRTRFERSRVDQQVAESFDLPYRAVILKHERMPSGRSSRNHIVLCLIAAGFWHG